ncbi:hypothetical protein [Burkholderia ambifaria]|uniref:hypothetical protein n=1 Tax=Burkholderia ambifaria TaxID=152480 RepID=UPI001BA08577|nr:hypothetical protein [Burkholderia ambifaria]MBR8225761.1 hypothetical protein [Burkholderia ambifaria]
MLDTVGRPMPGVTAGQRGELGIATADNPPDTGGRKRPSAPVFVLTWFFRWIATADEIPAHEFYRKSDGGLEGAHRDVRLDYARRANCTQKRRSRRILFMRVVERFAPPVTEKAANAAFADLTGREEAEPKHACPIVVVGLVDCLEQPGNVDRQQVRPHQFLDTAAQHHAVWQLHAMRNDVRDLGLGEPRAMPPGY